MKLELSEKVVGAIMALFKSTYLFDDCFLYDYIYSHTKDKTVLFGYFGYADDYFYGKINNGIIKAYSADIALRFFNPMITAEKTDSNNVRITIEYNPLHYIVMAIAVIMGLLIPFLCASYPLSLLIALLFAFVIISICIINYNHLKKKIIEYFSSVKCEQSFESD